MTTGPERLGLTVCGAPLASRAADVLGALEKPGRPIEVRVTEAARQWTDISQPAPEHPARRPPLVVACPLTFNTANKIARGIMDNQVTGMLCDGLGAGARIVAVPFVNDRLWHHPAWSDTLRTLIAAGVVFLDPHDGRHGPPVAVRSGTGAAVVNAFDPAWLFVALDE